MFIIKYFLNDKIIGFEKFTTLEGAENQIEDSKYYHKANRYEIIDSETDEVIIDEEIVNPDDVIEDMFDGEDSKEGFDWTLED